MIETKQMDAGAAGNDGLKRFLVMLPREATPRQRVEALQEAARRFTAEAADAPEPEITEDRWTTPR